MPVISSRESEEEGIMSVARLMLVSARTAPKSGGVDDIFTVIVSEAEKERLGDEMENIGKERQIAAFQRDARNVRDSALVVLIGVKGNKKLGLNCGACGYVSCDEFEKAEKKSGQDFSCPSRYLNHRGYVRLTARHTFPTSYYSLTVSAVQDMPM